MELLNYNNMTWDDLLKSSSYINATEDRKAAMQNEWLDSFMADFTPEELQLGAQKLTQDILNSTSISQGQVFNALRRAGYVMPTQDAVPKQDTKHFRLDDVIPHFDNKVLEMYRQTGIAALSSYAQILNGLEAIPAAVARAQGIIDTQVLPQNETIWDPKIKRYVTRPNKARQEAGKRYLEYVDNAHDRMEKRIKDAQRMLDENNVNIKVWEHLKQGDFGEAAQGMVNTMAKGLMEHSLQMATAYAVGPLASSALMGVSVEEQKYAELRHSDLPEWQKNTIAILDGTWEFIFEHLSTEQLFRRMQMGEGDLLTAWAKDPSSRNLIFGAVKSLLIPCFTEGSEEFVTEWAQQITDYLGQAHNKEEFKELAKDIKRKGIWKNILDQAMEAGIAGGLVGIGMAGKSTFDQANTIKNLQNASDYSRAAFNYYMRKAKEDRMPAKYATEEQRRQALKDYQEKGAPITFDEPTASDWYYSYVTRLSELEHQGIDLDTEGKDGDIYRKIRERFNAFVQTPEGKAVHDQIEAEYRQRLEQEAAQQAQQQPGEQPMAQPTPAEQQPTQALPAEVQPVETPAPLEQPKENKFPTKQKVDPKSQYSVDYKPGETKITDTNGEEAQVAVIGDKPQIRYFADEQSGVKGYWAFVSAKTLEVSKWLNNATQNRDMSTKQSRETVAAIKNGLKNNPSQTLDSRTVDHGAPTVIPVNDEKGNTHLQVHFGNHRAEATIEGYSDAEIAQALRTVATEHAQKNNIDISSIQDPILVFIESEAQTVEQVQQGTQRGNHTATRQMTPSQNAQSDALLLAQHPEVLKKFVPGGNLSTDNFDFLRDFMQITDTMNAGLLDEKNRPTMEAENRVARAMFAYFLRNESPERQERMLKSVIDNAGDNNIVSLVRGIMSNAPALAQLEEKFPDYALGKEMINALDSYLEYKRARSKGEFNNIENWFNQTTMDFGDKNQKKLDLNDVEKDLTRIFDKVKTIKGIRTFFNTFTDKVHEEAGGEGLFSDVQKRTKAEIIHDLAQKTLEPEEDTSGTTANASVENESTEHAPRVESARVADVTQEGQQATNEAVQEKRRNIDNAVKVAKRLFPGYTIHVHDTLTDIPREHKAQIPEDGIAQCYNDGNHGIHVIAENMPSDPATIRQIIMSHEIVGHDGLKQLLGNRYDKMLDSVYADHKNDIKPIAKLYGYNLNKVEELREATEEWLARNANIEDRPSWFNRLVAKIRATLRVMFNIKWSDNDIRSCFIEAARNLQEQSGSQHIRFAISDSQTTLDAAAKQLGIDLNAETQEFRDVFKQYYGTPQWMKAPNGKPTNLTARQWVQVRTPAFKRWFGNWEAEFEEQRMRNTVKEWLSNENIEKARGKLRSEIFEMFGNDLEAVAHIPIEYLPYLSDGIEDNRVYSGKGYLIDHAVNHHPEVEITSYGNIQNIIDTADDVKLDNKNPGRNPSILFIKQVDPTGVVVVSFDEGENGKIVLHKSFFEKTKKGRFDKLPSIKNGANASLMVGNPIISPAADATAAVRRISALNDNNTINHGNYFVKSDFSKIVDENGEPMVVYHGTEGSFTVFDKTKGRANMDIQGMFFSPWEDDARGYGSRLMPCFLNIRHPASEGQAYKALKAHQGENNAGVKAREDLIAQGFDGVNNENEEFIAFEPTQIKSATDNVGTFSNENPDIRFSLVSDAKVKEEFQDSDKYIETYRSAMLGEDGKLYPPMATKGGEGMELGQVYRSDERPELRNKKGKFPLKSDMRDSGKQGNVDAAYNPYFHSQPGVLNDQFSVAYDKSRMVTVKCRVLKSDIESGYWAEGAKDPVGYAEWGTSGPVTKQLRNRGGRTVILSRYIMPVEIVPDSEVARMIKEQIGDEDVTIPWNVVPPNLRNELAKTGVQVGTEEDFRQAEAEKNAKRKKNVLPTKGVRFSLIGEDGASQLDKSEGVTLRMDNLAIAKQMLQAKKGDLAIRLATGWERGADGKWRYEIDDSQVKLDNFGLAQFQRENPDYAWLRNIEDRIFAENYELTPDENKRYEELSKKYNGIEKRALDKIKSYMGTRLSAILDYHELYKAYPHFKYMSVFFVPNASYEGKYDGAAFYLAVDVANNELWSNAYVKSVLLHEIQHAIQQEEGFTRGSNPTKAGSTANYNRVAGEVESRNVERRMLLPTQKRRSTQLSATEDVPRHAQTTDFEYPIKLGGDIVDSAKLDKMFFTDHSLSEDEWDAYNKYISYGPVVGKAKLEAMLQSGIETFVESAKKQLPIFERIEGVEPIMKEDEHIRWSLQQAESAKKRLSELWENGNIRQDEVISIGNVEANVQEASKKLGLELPDNLSFIIRGGELQHLKNDHPELTSQDIERLVTAWINPDYLGLALGKNVKKMFLITQDDSSDAMGVIIIGLQKKQAHLKTFYIAERSKLLNSLKQKSTPLVEVAKPPAMIQ